MKVQQEIRVHDKAWYHTYANMKVQVQSHHSL